MVGATWVPCRGDVIWITISPRTGHEQSGRRPALVLSPETYNAKTGLAVMCPITNQVKGYPFEVPLPDGLCIAGVVLSDQVKSLDWRARDGELACTVPSDTTGEVARRLGRLLPL